MQPHSRCCQFRTKKVLNQKKFQNFAKSNIKLYNTQMACNVQISNRQISEFLAHFTVSRGFIVTITGRFRNHFCSFTATCDNKNGTTTFLSFTTYLKGYKLHFHRVVQRGNETANNHCRKVSSSSATLILKL